MLIYCLKWFSSPQKLGLATCNLTKEVETLKSNLGKLLQFTVYNKVTVIATNGYYPLITSEARARRLSIQFYNFEISAVVLYPYSMCVDLKPQNDLGERQLAIETRAVGYFDFSCHRYIIIIIPIYHVMSVE